MLYGFYQLFGWLTFVLGGPIILLYSLCTGRNRRGLSQRLGFLGNGWDDETRSVRIWIHGASVGEVLLAKLLIKELAAIIPEADFVLTTMTEQGMEIALKDPCDKVRCVYAPLDLVGIVGRSIRKIKPAAYVCLETELWPALLLRAKQSGCKMVILNGRLTERSCRRYHLAKGLMKEIISCFSVISVIQQSDARRFISLGAEPGKVRIYGNAKYDQDVKSLAVEGEAQYRQWLDLQSGQPLLVAGSTHTGEERLLLKAFQDLKKTTGFKDMILVVAPRHLQRLAEVEDMLRQHRVPFERLSEVRNSKRQTDTILVDSIGDLAGFYSIATYVFCGGSLVERGGHNVMEAAVFGKPVFYGPSMKDFSDAVELLESAGAGFRVSNTEELTESILYFMDHPEEYASAGRQAREVAVSQQGSARKQAELVKEVLREH